MYATGMTSEMTQDHVSWGTGFCPCVCGYFPAGTPPLLKSHIYIYIYIYIYKYIYIYIYKWFNNGAFVLSMVIAH